RLRACPNGAVTSVVPLRSHALCLPGGLKLSDSAHRVVSAAQAGAGPALQAPKDDMDPSRKCAQKGAVPDARGLTPWRQRGPQKSQVAELVSEPVGPTPALTASSRTTTRRAFRSTSGTNASVNATSSVLPVPARRTSKRSPAPWL